MALDNADRPDYQDAESAQMQKEATIMRDVTEGTLHIQSKGTEYLPKYYMESKEDYEARKKNSDLLPATAEAIENVVGKVLSKPTQINDLEDDDFYTPNIDGAGTNFKSFESLSLKKAVRDGMGYIVIDFAAVGSRTRVQEKSDKIKPYLKYVLSYNLINKRTEIRNGKTILTQATIRELSTKPHGDFGTKDIENYLVYRKTDAGVTLQVYEKDNDKITAGDVVTLNMNGLTEIPIVPLYTGQKSPFYAKPIFGEMAQINLSVYRMNSGLKRTIYNVGDPTHVIYGQVPTDDNGQPLPLVVGSSNMLNLDSDSKYEIVGMTADSIQPTKEEIETMKLDMQKIATEVTSIEVEKTATQSNIDNSNQKSKLNSIATNLENTWNEVKRFYLAFLGREDKGSIVVNRDFDTMTMSVEQIRELRNDYLANIITKETYIKERQKGETLMTIEDIEKEILEAENQAGMNLNIQ